VNGTWGRRTLTITLLTALVAMVLPVPAQAITLPAAVPTAHDDQYTASSDSGAPALAPAAPGVLANDSGSPLTALIVTNPTHASAFRLNSNGSFSYTPMLNYVGTDSFTYKANNGHADSAPATVTITVAHGNLPPVISVPGGQNAVQGIALTFSTANTNAISVTDPDAGTNPLVVGLGVAHGTITVGTAGVTVTGNGSNAVQVTGAQSAITAALNGMTYTASAAYSGPDTLAVHADDQGNSGAGGAKTDDKNVSITVTSVPGVTSTTPANNATNVLATTTVSITFSKSVNVTGTAFKLECPTGTPVAFTTSGTGPATVFTLTPTSPLPAGVVCTVTVVASQVTDASNNSHPTADYTFSFTVDTPPTVSSTTPANSATNVALNSTITVTFSKAVSVTGSAFKLECPTGTPVAFATSPAGPTATYTLTPSANLPAGVVCTITVVAAQVTDAAGTHLATDLTASFTTDTAPVVQSTTPTNNAQNVALTGPVIFTFDKAVTAASGAFTLACNTVAQPFTLSASPATTYTLTPNSALPGGASCTATAVAANLTDAAGTHPAADVPVNFTTDTAPTVTSTTPTGGATNQAPTTTITVNFSKPVTVTGTAFKLECPAGTPVAFTVTPASPASSYVLHPTSNLPVTTQCTVTVVATQVTDSVGTPMAADAVVTFTVGTPPTVRSTSPTTGATSVATTSKVTLNFSASVATDSSSFKLECPSGSPVAFSVAPAAPGPSTSCVLTPSSDLPQTTTCTVTAVATHITDSGSGLAMTGNYTYTFTTNTLPTVSSTTPANSATNQAPTTTITVVFS
jgi:methionine-rich copper-binding protein CopC